MKKSLLIKVTAGVVFAICLYSFLSGNQVFKGKFENEYVAWYFLAKGIFCAAVLLLLGEIVKKEK